MKLEGSIVCGMVGIFGIVVAGMIALLILAPQIAAISVPILITSILIPLFGLFAAKISTISNDVHVVAEKVETATMNIQKIETATNSMKDALVASTGDTKRAEGLAEGLAAGETKGRADQAVVQAGEKLT